MHDLVIRGGTLVRPGGLERADVAVDGDQISAIGPELGAAKLEIDARELHVFPGVIDVHVHFNEPGRTLWEGVASGSRALAAGGGTLFFDMPLNSLPCTVNASSLAQKLEAMQQNAATDFALWGGLVPGNLAHLPDLAAGGVVGFKAFMSDSGLEEFPRADDYTLYQGMLKAKELGLPVAVHAESEELTRGLSESALAAGKRGVRDYLQSRPVLAELEAIQRALLLAQQTGCKLHLVHVSSGQGVAMVVEAKAKGVDVSLETCPHYLFFTDEDMERLQGALKCAPPLRSRRERDHLWQRVLDGQVDLIASDHSPSPPELKKGEDFFKLWGGIAGVQSTLSVLVTEGYDLRGLSLEAIARLTAESPAKRFRLARKGALEAGYDADITLVDLGSKFVLREQDLLQRHPVSPYLNRSFRGKVRQTLVRGFTVYFGGRALEGAWGKLARPGL